MSNSISSIRPLRMVCSSLSLLNSKAQLTNVPTMTNSTPIPTRPKRDNFWGVGQDCLKWSGLYSPAVSLWRDFFLADSGACLLATVQTWPWLDLTYLTQARTPPSAWRRTLEDIQFEYVWHLFTMLLSSWSQLLFWGRQAGLVNWPCEATGCQLGMSLDNARGLWMVTLSNHSLCIPS